jgi:Domain of unknown function (DUF4390)
MRCTRPGKQRCTLFANTMAFFTHSFAKLHDKMPRLLEQMAARVSWLCLALLLSLACPRAQAQSVQIESIQLHKADEGLQLSATLGFELPQMIQEALHKGIPIVFSTQVDLQKDRWYWYDKTVVSHTKQVRLSYQPLTRRWRVQVNDSTQGASSGLSQHHDSLTQALSAVRRINRWKIAEWSDLEPDAKYTVEFRFRLDTSQLPKPFQIGAGASSEWSLQANRDLRFLHDGKLEAAK